MDAIRRFRPDEIGNGNIGAHKVAFNYLRSNWSYWLDNGDAHELVFLIRTCANYPISASWAGQVRCRDTVEFFTVTLVSDTINLVLESGDPLLASDLISCIEKSIFVFNPRIDYMKAEVAIPFLLYRKLDSIAKRSV